MSMQQEASGMLGDARAVAKRLLQERIAGLEDNIRGVDVPTMEDFRKDVERKIRNFSRTEYKTYGSSSSYTPWYKDKSVPAWKRVAYRMCEDQRTGNEPGHVRVTKSQLEDNLDSQCATERTRRQKIIRDLNSRLRDARQSLRQYDD